MKGTSVPEELSRLKMYNVIFFSGIMQIMIILSVNPISTIIYGRKIMFSSITGN
jgi:hypothetical protein